MGRAEVEDREMKERQIDSKFPLPACEDERLATLAELDILDTDAERSFDQLAELATLVCETPTALFTLVDRARQWFKARVGLDPTETSREVSFCAHVVAQDDPMVVEDALQDARFCDNSLVTGPPHIRFYAGVPVRVDGYPIGTLCVIDQRPRELSDRQLEALSALAEQVEGQLDLRRQLRRAEETRRRLDEQRTEIEIVSGALDQLTEHIDEVFWVMSHDLGEIFYASPNASRMWGVKRDEMYRDAATVFQRIHPDDRAQAVAGLAAAGPGAPESVSYRLIDEQGEVTKWLRSKGFKIESSTGPARFAGLTSEITEERAVQAELETTRRQLWRAQKMESLGRMAGGIAHDFNNMLSVIAGCATFLLEDLDVDDPSRVDAVDICEATDRSAQLTRQLLAFSRTQVLEAQVVDLDSAVEDSMALLRRLLSVQVDLSVDASSDGLEVYIDQGQFEQVLTNLVVNARDAVAKHGHIWVQTRKAALIDGEHDLVPGGVYGVISVRDDGEGMESAVLEQIFEPFFTTKAAGEGTGLGLATVHGIVSQSGGFIEVDSTPGEGSEFVIWLPKANKEQRARHLEVFEPPPRQVEWNGDVLLVEDNPLVRRTMKRTLEREGFDLHVAASGAEAVELWREHRDTIVAVACDVRMPDMGGPELLDLLRADEPDLPAVLITGHADPDQLSVLDERITATLSKPIGPRELSDALVGLTSR